MYVYTIYKSVNCVVETIGFAPFRLLMDVCGVVSGDCYRVRREKVGEGIFVRNNLHARTKVCVFARVHFCDHMSCTFQTP